MPGKWELRKSCRARAAIGFVLTGACIGILVGSWGTRIAGAEPGVPLPAAPALTPLLASGQTVAGETIVYPTSAPARVTAAIVMLAPGKETGWHSHDVPTFGYVLEGELTVDYGANGKRVYRAGDALLEAMAVVHNGKNTGQAPMRILAVFMGSDATRQSVPCTDC